MSDMSSRMYGLKVKEKKDHYDYKDPWGNDAFAVYYNNGTWSVISKYNRMFYNGIQYTVGTTIVSFKDGDFLTCIIMGQYDDEDNPGLYVNILYEIKVGGGSSEIESNTVITYNVSCEGHDDVLIQKFQNGVRIAYKNINSSTIIENKQKYSGQLLKVFGLQFDFHSMDPEDPYPQMSFTVKAGNDYIKYEGQKKYTNQDIVTFQMTSTVSYDIVDEYNRHHAKLQQGELTRIEISYGGNQGRVSFNKESDSFGEVLHDHVAVFYNNKYHRAMFLVYDNPSIYGCWRKKIGALALTYAEPFWMLMTTQDGVEYGGRTYPERVLINSWKNDEEVNMTLRFSTSRKRELPNPDSNKFDKIVYDVQCFAPSGHVVLNYEINSGVTDSIEFNPSDAPVRFHNIEFKAYSDRWSIISKCGFIKYDGKTYKNNRSIVYIGFNENLHIEIQDQSNIYEIAKTTVYTIKTERIGSITYKVWTGEISRTIKVEKSVNGIPEPWVTINYYDAMYDVVEVGDLVFNFDPGPMAWYLNSNNDDLYNDGINYRKGELITSWGFSENIKLNHLTVLMVTDEMGVEVNTRTSGQQPYLGNDIDEIFDEGIKICHSYTKGLWELKSVNDNTFYLGNRFLEGEVIISFPEKVVLDEFSILVQKIIEGEQVNVLYQCYTTVDILNGITQLHINGNTWNSKGISPDNVTELLSTSMCKSLYGYIWKSWGGSGPSHKDYTFDIIAINIQSDFNGYKYIAAVNTEFGERIVTKLTYTQVYGEMKTSDTWLTVSNDDVAYLKNGWNNYLYYRAYGTSGSFSISKINGNIGGKYIRCDGDNVYFYDIISVDDTTVRIRLKKFDKYLFIQESDEETEDQAVSLLFYTDSNTIVIEKDDTVILSTRPVMSDSPFISHCAYFEFDKSSLEVVSVRNAYAFNYSEIYNEAKTDLALNPDEETGTEHGGLIYNIGNESLRYYVIYHAEAGAGGNSYYWTKVFKYNEETMTLSSNTKFVNEIPTFIGKIIHCNGKLYVYHTPLNTTYIKIYESDYDIDSLMSNQILVNTLNQDSDIQIFRIDTKEYVTISIADILGRNIDTLMYNDLNKRFGKNKTGYFSYVDINQYGTVYYDKLIVYIDDPTFQNTNHAFAFAASALRYVNQIGDD